MHTRTRTREERAATADELAESLKVPLKNLTAPLSSTAEEETPHLGVVEQLLGGASERKLTGDHYVA